MLIAYPLDADSVMFISPFFSLKEEKILSKKDVK